MALHSFVPLSIYLQCVSLLIFHINVLIYLSLSLLNCVCIYFNIHLPLPMWPHVHVESWTDSCQLAEITALLLLEAIKPEGIVYTVGGNTDKMQENDPGKRLENLWHISHRLTVGLKADRITV